jgi:hypothetical protein
MEPVLRIQKPQQKREVKKICYLTFFVATNITKLEIILFWCEEKKNVGQLSKN